MKSKQELLIDFLNHEIKKTKTGLIIKGVVDDDINLEEVLNKINKKKVPLYVSIVGYNREISYTINECEISSSIEDAVLWRNTPECAGSILVFIKSDTEKMHSLAEFEIVTNRNISRFLLRQQLNTENNTPTQNFWMGLLDTSDCYTFESIYDFVSAVCEFSRPENAIIENMWRINLLADPELLGTKYDTQERLAKNRELISEIARLNEDSRKKLSSSLAKLAGKDKERLQNAYNTLQYFYKYGKRETLKDLDVETVQRLLNASKDNGKKKNEKSEGEEGNGDQEPHDNGSLSPNKTNELASRAIVFANEEDIVSANELFDKLDEYYGSLETGLTPDEITPVGGIFEDKRIIAAENQTDLRRLIGKYCNMSAWGGLMKTEESVLKDAISADASEENFFEPDSPNSITSFSGGIEGDLSLFDFIEQFDEKFKGKGYITEELFKPIIHDLKEQRKILYSNMDMLLYYPILLFGISDSCQQALIRYIEDWEKLYSAICENEPKMKDISVGGTSFIARAILLLDVLYVKTPKEWKAILMPLHPVFLWKYYEVFRSLSRDRETLSDNDKETLASVLTALPQVLNFVVANKIVTSYDSGDNSEEKVLPCSGNIEMLPTFENKTNRYLGNDGVGYVEEILSRWIGFAPYTINEIRICSVDIPDLISVLRQIKSFMVSHFCGRVVYDVYYTRNQNSNTELSKLDFTERDYEISEYINNDRISVSIKNVQSVNEVKEFLNSRPVHLAIYFDQSSYTIEYGPSNRNLYITPLVITYDYDFDEIQHKGTIFPSSEAENGLICNYHKIMRSADIISNNMNPRTTYNGNADVSSVVSTIEDCQAQWLVVADRDTNNYQPRNAIPIGEKQFDRRIVNVWTSDQSRIITQYLTLLRGYNLYPKAEVLVQILRQFGHISSNGLISIPKYGADAHATENKKKGLIGTLFAASWYTKQHEDALIASLDDDKASVWLKDRNTVNNIVAKTGNNTGNNIGNNERADLIGLYYDKEKNILHVEPIEVKTRDESPDCQYRKDSTDSKRNIITGHAADQLAETIELLRGIFSYDENSTDMFKAARREVLKYQIVSECFRNIHDSNWQKRWYDIFKKTFSNLYDDTFTIEISGVLVYIKLNESNGGEHVKCYHPNHDDCNIDFWKLTAKEIQTEVLGQNVPFNEIRTPDFDDDQNLATEEEIELSHDSVIEVEGGLNSVCVETGSDSDINSQENNSETSSTQISGKDEQEENHPKSVITKDENGVSIEEINQLVKDFRRACVDYHVALRDCKVEDTVVGPSVIRLKFRLSRGQSLQSLSGHLEDIGRDMRRTGIIIQQVRNSDELLLDVPRLKREMVLFKDVVPKLPKTISPEELYFPLGRTPNGDDLIEDLGQMPHMLVGGSTGSGKTVFLFSMLASLLMTHPNKEDMQLILSSSKLEDFIHFEGLPHLYSGGIISDAAKATEVITDVIFKESESRGKLLADSRVANIVEYNKKAEKKLAPIVVVIDEFADLADQLDSKKQQDAFYRPVQRIAATGRSRGIHLVICTQRPEAKLVPSTTKAQLNGRVALRVNDGISSKMIIESMDAQYLQKHGDMIYRNADIVERAQGYLITVEELDSIIHDIVNDS